MAPSALLRFRRIFRKRLGSRHTYCVVTLMSEDEYQKGLANIRGAVQEALDRLGVTNANVQLTEQPANQKQDVILSISSDGKTQSQAFSRDEVVDSGEAIDAPAATKVRMLASHFVK